ncbi:MAG: T9SS type A sorting domain-containing protein [Chitinophagales bacterium]|nr:T9SS type A sorting domain-containing protein [Chitinophagales bacterium]
MKCKFFLSFFVLSALGAESQLSNGLIAKYYFNNANANDDGGKYHGKVNGAVLTSDRFGNPNKAYQFGMNQTITVNDNVALDGYSSAFSISFWLKSSGGTNTNSLISKFSYCGGNSDAFNIYISNTNSLVSQFGDEMGLDVYQFGKKVVADNNWHHVVVIWNKPNVKFYIDTIVDSFSRNDLFNSTMSNSDEVLAFGQPITNYCPYTYNYNEKLDDIRLYNRPLTRKEVDTLYSEPNPNSITSSVDRDDHSHDPISIFPNPTNGIINFSRLYSPSEATIYSLDGRKIKSFINNEVINIANLDNGIYILNYEDKNWRVILDKIS